MKISIEKSNFNTSQDDVFFISFRRFSVVIENPTEDSIRNIPSSLWELKDEIESFIGDDFDPSLTTLEEYQGFVNWVSCIVSPIYRKEYFTNRILRDLLSDEDICRVRTEKRYSKGYAFRVSGSVATDDEVGYENGEVIIISRVNGVIDGEIPEGFDKCIYQSEGDFDYIKTDKFEELYQTWQREEGYCE